MRLHSRHTGFVRTRIGFERYDDCNLFTDEDILETWKQQDDVGDEVAPQKKSGLLAV